MVSNPSFELGPGLEGNPISAWTDVGNVGLGSSLLSHGQRAAWIAGPFTGEADASTFYIHAECSSGWQHTVSVDAGHASENPLEGAARVYLIARWLDDSQTILQEKYITILNSAAPTDQMASTSYTFDPAPAGTTRVKVEFSFNQTAAQESGRAWVDNLAFTLISPAINQWGDFGNTYLSFEGYSWRVKDAYQGPGPNLFSDSLSNATVNQDGELVLGITNTNGQWRCAEVVLEDALGYGTYRFKTNTRMDQLDPNIIFQSLYLGIPAVLFQ